VNRLATARGPRCNDDSRQFAGGPDRSPLAICGDAPGDAPGVPLLPILSEDPLQLRSRQGVDQLRRAGAGPGAEAHIERCIPLETEAPVALIELGRADSEIEEDALDIGKS